MKLLGTGDAARLSGFSRSMIARWCDDGGLKCKRSPKGFRYIWADDLVRFLVRHGCPVNERLRAIAEARQ